MQYTARCKTPLGGVTLASDGESLTGLWFDGQKYFGAGLCAEPIEKDLPIFDEAREWLNVYFGGKQPDFTPPLLLRGSAFRRAVWENAHPVRKNCNLRRDCALTFGGIRA